MKKLLTEVEIISILETKMMDLCSDFEKKQVMAFAFGEEFMASDDKGEKKVYEVAND
jgi:hypothetical protein